MASEEFMAGRELGILEQRIRILASYVISSSITITPGEIRLDELYKEYKALASKYGFSDEHFREIREMYDKAAEKMGKGPAALGEMLR